MIHETNQPRKDGKRILGGICLFTLGVALLPSIVFHLFNLIVLVLLVRIAWKISLWIWE